MLDAVCGIFAAASGRGIPFHSLVGTLDLMRAFHFLSADHAVQALNKQRLKVALLNELNDPFELFASDLSDVRIRRGFKVWKDQMSRKIGLLCFSRRWRNPLLWSHYGSKHTGVALECAIDDQVVVPVRYRKSRLRLDVAHMMSSSRGFSADLAEKLASTKSTHWRYEEEIRVPIQLADCMIEEERYFREFTSQMRLVGIVLGPLCTLNQRDVEAALPRGERITLRRARLAFRSFNIVPDRSVEIRVVDGAA